jgi:DNA polymerase-1
VLEELAPQHDLPGLVLQYRQLTKLKGTYVDALPALVLPRDGRLHTSFGQTVAATGPACRRRTRTCRTSRSARRSAATCGARSSRGPGWKLVSADYSQIELRIMAHLSRDQALVDAFSRGEDVHAGTAQRVFGLPRARSRAPSSARWRRSSTSA